MSTKKTKKKSVPESKVKVTSREVKVVTLQVSDGEWKLETGRDTSTGGEPIETDDVEISAPCGECIVCNREELQELATIVQNHFKPL